jgi:hypothetical protein
VDPFEATRLSMWNINSRNKRCEENNDKVLNQRPRQFTFPRLDKSGFTRKKACWAIKEKKELLWLCQENDQGAHNTSLACVISNDSELTPLLHPNKQEEKLVIPNQYKK